jgi:thymidylate synthase (FAD)
MKYLNLEEFLKEHERMQLADISIEPNSVHLKETLYDTKEVLEWDQENFLTYYDKWFKANEKVKDLDCYGHATIQVYEHVRKMLMNLRFLYANQKGIPGPFEGVFPEARRPNIFGDEIAFVEKWNFSRANLNEKNRIMAITQVASICYQSGKSLGSESLYNRLLAESHGLPSSSFEFVPMLLSEDEYWRRVETQLPEGFAENNQLTKFGEWIEDNGKKYLLTNFRAAVYMKEYYPEVDLTDFYNTEDECQIIERHFNVFLYKVDFPTRSQMVRHRVNWQELSRRYVSGKRVGFDFYISEKMKDVAVLDNHGDVIFNTQSLIEDCVRLYFAALEQGIKPQEARRIIPQAGYTQLWGAFQPTQLANYFRLRDDSHAQWEIHQTAIAMKDMITSLEELREDMEDPERQAEIARRIKSIEDGTCEFISEVELVQMLQEKDINGSNC